MREFFFSYKVKREEAREVNGGKKNMVPTLPLLRFPSNLNKNRPERPRARPWARPSSTPARPPRPARPRLLFSPRKESPSRRRLPVPRQRLAAAFLKKKKKMPLLKISFAWALLDQAERAARYIQ